MLRFSQRVVPMGRAVRRQGRDRQRIAESPASNAAGDRFDETGAASETTGVRVRTAGSPLERYFRQHSRARASAQRCAHQLLTFTAVAGDGCLQFRQRAITRQIPGWEKGHLHHGY